MLPAPDHGSQPLSLGSGITHIKTAGNAALKHLQMLRQMQA